MHHLPDHDGYDDDDDDYYYDDDNDDVDVDDDDDDDSDNDDGAEIQPPWRRAHFAPFAWPVVSSYKLLEVRIIVEQKMSRYWIFPKLAFSDDDNDDDDEDDDDDDDHNDDGDDDGAEVKKLDSFKNLPSPQGVPSAHGMCWVLQPCACN